MFPPFAKSQRNTPKSFSCFLLVAVKVIFDKDLMAVTTVRRQKHCRKLGFVVPKEKGTLFAKSQRNTPKSFSCFLLVVVKVIFDKDLTAVMTVQRQKHCRKLGFVVSKEKGMHAPTRVFWFLRFDSLGWAGEEAKPLLGHHGDKL